MTKIPYYAFGEPSQTMEPLAETVAPQEWSSQSAAGFLESNSPGDTAGDGPIPRLASRLCRQRAHETGEAAPEAASWLCSIQKPGLRPKAVADSVHGFVSIPFSRHTKQAV